ncbi:hypothetical protein EYF80_013570 [Liparis tanakae]|uniref:Uncharacterized protein n=1 Tax=Liparis tanakae TaxID=230148 RepID=A0A4Z2IG56_9TELE|nr:hypothetical protein EYF80_013570 [Liparis tanakae]
MSDIGTWQASQLETPLPSCPTTGADATHRIVAAHTGNTAAPTSSTSSTSDSTHCVLLPHLLSTNRTSLAADIHGNISLALKRDELS